MSTTTTITFAGKVYNVPLTDVDITERSQGMACCGVSLEDYESNCRTFPCSKCAYGPDNHEVYKALREQVSKDKEGSK